MSGVWRRLTNFSEPIMRRFTTLNGSRGRVTSAGRKSSSSRVTAGTELAGSVHGSVSRTGCPRPGEAPIITPGRVGPSNYFGRWSRSRNRALERDDYCCQICGRGPEELGQNPDVHHIKPLRSFEDPQDAHYIDNLVALCRACHQRVEPGEMAAPRPTARHSQE